MVMNPLRQGCGIDLEKYQKQIRRFLGTLLRRLSVMTERKLLTLAVVAVFAVFCLNCGRSQSEHIDQESDRVQEKPSADLSRKITGKDGAPMVLVPAGEFQMGTDRGELDEQPVHRVYLDAFYIDKYEVTNARYRQFTQATGHKEPEGYAYEGGKRRRVFRPWSDANFNNDNQPVVCVSWEDAKAYCKWAGKRLPTEAEWEKAARGGLVGKKYPWGDIQPDGTQCNFGDRSIGPSYSESASDGHKYIAPVGSFKPNGYGLYDMAGNVSEWCADWFGQRYYSISPNRNPPGPALGQERLVRGGSWLFDPYSLGVARRDTASPSSTSTFTGFRCVQEITP